MFYRLELDAESSAYVGVTAVPKPGSKVGFGDGFEVSVQDADGATCGSGRARIGSSQSPRPVTAWAQRQVGPNENRCAGAGTYYVVVQRERSPVSGATIARGSWDLELSVASEPGLKGAGNEPTEAPDTWDSASPVPAAGERRMRAGGAGFDAATGLEAGVWGDRIAAGETLFYRVPVDWGQRMSATAELGSKGSGRDFDYVTSALSLSLYNPVRGQVAEADTAYDGKQKSASLDPLPPVAYENRYSTRDAVTGMRFAGWYYLAVHLNPAVRAKFGKEPLDLTLRVDVKGIRKKGPAYAGAARPSGVFAVTGRDKDAARSGATRAGAAVESGDATMKAVAAGGIGTGVVLLVVLGVWTLVGRRRAKGMAAAVVGAGVDGGGGDGGGVGGDRGVSGVRGVQVPPPGGGGGPSGW
ncbi:hypothetical protein [Streptomyces sp. NPDC059009]|uniref:hypothetical protein n=1 Tax=Streptomyces sp. NPDC059009 TaxID=3346694 RepID=UPI0036CEB4E6